MQSHWYPRLDFSTFLRGVQVPTLWKLCLQQSAFSIAIEENKTEYPLNNFQKEDKFID